LPPFDPPNHPPKKSQGHKSPPKKSSTITDHRQGLSRNRKEIYRHTHVDHRLKYDGNPDRKDEQCSKKRMDFCGDDHDSQKDEHKDKNQYRRSCYSIFFYDDGKNKVRGRLRKRLFENAFSGTHTADASTVNGCFGVMNLIGFYSVSIGFREIFNSGFPGMDTGIWN